MRGQPPLPGIGAEDVAIQEEHGLERLVLRGRRDAALLSEPCQERRNLGDAHRARVALAREHDIAPYPSDVRFFGAATVLAQSHFLADPVEQPGDSGI